MAEKYDKINLYFNIEKEYTKSVPIKKKITANLKVKLLDVLDSSSVKELEREYFNEQAKLVGNEKENINSIKDIYKLIKYNKGEDKVIELERDRIAIETLKLIIDNSSLNENELELISGTVIENGLFTEFWGEQDIKEVHNVVNFFRESMAK